MVMLTDTSLHNESNKMLGELDAKKKTIFSRIPYICSVFLDVVLIINIFINYRQINSLLFYILFVFLCLSFVVLLIYFIRNEMKRKNFTKLLKIIYVTLSKSTTKETTQEYVTNMSFFIEELYRIGRLDKHGYSIDELTILFLSSV